MDINEKEYTEFIAKFEGKSIDELKETIFTLSKTLDMLYVEKEETSKSNQYKIDRMQKDLHNCEWQLKKVKEDSEFYRETLESFNKILKK